MTARRISRQEALEALAGEWGEGWVLQPPERAHIPRRPSLGGPIDTVRFYVRNEGEALDAVLANLPAAPVRVAGLAAERWTEDEG